MLAVRRGGELVGTSQFIVASTALGDGHVSFYFLHWMGRVRSSMCMKPRAPRFMTFRLTSSEGRHRKFQSKQYIKYCSKRNMQLVSSEV